MYWDPIPSFPIFFTPLPHFPILGPPPFPFFGVTPFPFGGVLVGITLSSSLMDCDTSLLGIISLYALFPFLWVFWPYILPFLTLSAHSRVKGGDRRAIGIGELFHPFYDKLEYASSMPSLEYLFNYQNFRDFIIFNQHQYHESWMIITWYPPWLAIAAERGAPS